MLGTIINSAAVIAASLIGCLLKKGFPQKISDSLMKGMGLCVIYIGVSGAVLCANLDRYNTLIMIVAMALGAVTGEALDLNRKLENLGDRMQKKFSSDGKSTFAEGFTNASLLFCVGAMAIVGSLESGLSGNHTTLITKSLIDAIAALVLASQFGIGVAVSAVSVFVYQGAITLLASVISPVLSEQVIASMSCIGSVLVAGIGLNMLGVTKLKLMNFVPAIFYAGIITYFKILIVG